MNDRTFSQGHRKREKGRHHQIWFEYVVWELDRYLVGALSPVSHKGLHQGWTQTSIYLQVIYFTSHVFWAYLYSAGTQHGILHPAGWSILFCGLTQEPVLVTANAGKNRERFWKNAGEWTGRVEIRKKFLAVSVACMAIYWPTPGFTGRTFKLSVLTRQDFNFYVCNSPLRGTVWDIRRILNVYWTMTVLVCPEVNPRCG